MLPLLPLLPLPVLPLLPLLPLPVLPLLLPLLPLPEPTGLPTGVDGFAPPFRPWMRNASVASPRLPSPGSLASSDAAPLQASTRLTRPIPE